MDAAGSVETVQANDAPEVAVSFEAEDARLYAAEYYAHVFVPRYCRTRSQRLRRRVNQGIALIALLHVTALSVYLVGTATESLFWSFVAFWSTPTAILGLYWLLKRALPLARLRESLRKANYRVRADADGVTIRTAEHAVTRYWHTIDDIAVSAHFFMIVPVGGKRECYPVPLHCFASREAAGLFLRAATESWKASGAQGVQPARTIEAH
jgi:hypothetical protein